MIRGFVHCFALGFTILMVAEGYGQDRSVRSDITIFDVYDGTRNVIYTSNELFEAPNWSPDGSYLLVNSQGRLYRLPISGGAPELVNTGDVNGINNDHGISSDGSQYVISAGQIFILPAEGGEPRQVTEKESSYFHGWSRDDKTLVYCGERNGNYDIYSITVEGGQERRLTVHEAFDDGPDFSSDGKWIYFHSDRGGSLDIWRMPVSGVNPEARAEQITSDAYEDWFPHPSPDGKWLVFLSYDEGTEGHPANRNVVLRMMSLSGENLKEAEIEGVVELLGGQGTINVPSWSPDSKFFAYVSYSLD
ncbi:MAG: transporter [Candidatus Neomarinimicrobiota bacterium]